ncbi:hypothetical protein LK996_02485 [Lysobacter sp. A6]|uniref:Uncharacterized protein n=1 Tax=Noviluteimonas lactosilytica TaxID=2888523 RepID=A0ABS8JEI0_9GAMM|nr:hypothetical protein [Lysobacter lactosilyticus]MCC8361952.1 hypothetical protein [Lysobacter lactosilyticus]
MEALRRNVAELTERMARLDVVTSRALGHNDAVQTLMVSVIETHPDLDALEASLQVHRPSHPTINEAHARELVRTLDLFEAVIERERHRRTGR